VTCEFQPFPGKQVIFALVEASFLWQFSTKMVNYNQTTISTIYTELKKLTIIPTMAKTNKQKQSDQPIRNRLSQENIAFVSPCKKCPST